MVSVKIIRTTASLPSYWDEILTIEKPFFMRYGTWTGHEAFFPIFLPGPVDVALWDIGAQGGRVAAV